MSKVKNLNKRVIWGAVIAVLAVILVWGAYANNLASIQGRFSGWNDKLSGTSISRISPPLSQIEFDWEKIKGEKDKSDSKIKFPWQK